MIYEKLIQCIKQFLNNRYSVQEFLQIYERAFLDNQEALHLELDDMLYAKFDGIYMCVDYYEPHPLIRQESSNYLDEEGLRNKISQLYKEINNSLKR